jgi:hypothetical protein
VPSQFGSGFTIRQTGAINRQAGLKAACRSNKRIRHGGKRGLSRELDLIACGSFRLTLDNVSDGQISIPEDPRLLKLKSSSFARKRIKKKEKKKKRKLAKVYTFQTISESVDQMRHTVIDIKRPGGSSTEGDELGRKSA